MNASIWFERYNPVSRMRRQHGKLLACVRHRLRSRTRDFVRRYNSCGRHAIKHTVACGAGGVGKTVRPAQFG
jgi:hypothetical protein